jgi:hypothetical protein
VKGVHFEITADEELAAHFGGIGLVCSFGVVVELLLWCLKSCVVSMVWRSEVGIKQNKYSAIYGQLEGWWGRHCQR